MNSRSRDEDRDTNAEPAIDWLSWLSRADFGDKLDLSGLAIGDVLLVETLNSRYRLVCENPDERWFEVRCAGRGARRAA